MSTTLLASHARAEAPAVIVEGCADIDGADLQRLLAIELRTLGSDITPVRDVRLRCSGEVVEVTRDDLVTKRPPE